MSILINDGSFAVRRSSERPAKTYFGPCKWCGNATDNVSRKCDECLRDIEIDRRIDAARGK
jgi:hypothetical protein